MPYSKLSALLHKVRTVFESCNTDDQLINAIRYSELACKHLLKHLEFTTYVKAERDMRRAMDLAVSRMHTQHLCSN